MLCASGDPELQRFVTQTLDPGYVSSAWTGREALASINSSAFDAYVLDYWLPDWSGVSLCREIRKDDPHVPICFFSKATSDDAKKRALRAGADAFLTIPLEPHALHSRVETLLASRRSSLVRAENEARRAIRSEFERRAAAAQLLSAHSTASGESAKRSARAKAMRAFLEAGGTRATFDRKWLQMYAAEKAPE
ncbi:MAG TPA: response regulator [Burkholderiales bacterium]|nr:response regulator [Burkholderiales bacterium]